MRFCVIDTLVFMKNELFQSLKAEMYLYISLEKKFLELRLILAGFRQEPRLRADSNTKFGVRIFILSDSNFFQS